MIKARTDHVLNPPCPPFKKGGKLGLRYLCDSCPSVLEPMAVPPLRGLPEATRSAGARLTDARSLFKPDDRHHQTCKKLFPEVGERKQSYQNNISQPCKLAVYRLIRSAKAAAMKTAQNRLQILLL